MVSTEKRGRNALAQAPCSLGGYIGVVECAGDRTGQRFNIVSRDEAVSQSSIDFRNSADVCGDERQSGRGSLQNDIGQGFRPRRYHHDAPKGLRLTRRHSRLELDDIDQTETPNLSL